LVVFVVVFVVMFVVVFVACVDSTAGVGPGRSPAANLAEPAKAARAQRRHEPLSWSR
jgi:hypothetical protein